jgi:hypothetical protein
MSLGIIGSKCNKVLLWSIFNNTKNSVCLLIFWVDANWYTLNLIMISISSIINKTLTKIEKRVKKILDIEVLIEHIKTYLVINRRNDITKKKNFRSHNKRFLITEYYTVIKKDF